MFVNCYIYNPAPFFFKKCRALVLLPGFAITQSEYVKHAVFQIWTQILVVSVSYNGCDFYVENISALETNFGWQEA